MQRKPTNTASGAVLKKIPEKTKKETAVEEFLRLESEDNAKKGK